MSASKRSLLAATALTLALGAGVGAGYASTSGDSGPGNNPDSGGADYDRTPDGRTIGILGGGPGEQQPDNYQPELVKIVADNGRVGYAELAKLLGPPPSSPDEAARRQEAGVATWKVPVYDEDGTTIIGETTVEGAKPDDVVEAPPVRD